MPTASFPSADLNANIADFLTFINPIDPEVNGRRQFPYSVWVDKSVISAAFNDPTVDGFRIIPMRYTTDVQSGGPGYKQGDVNFAILFTHPKTDGSGGHENNTTLLYDYNEPCPKPPCK